MSSLLKMLTVAGAMLAAMEMAPAATPSLEQAAGRYKISQSGSSLRFAVDQIAGRGLQGVFARFAGTIVIDGKNLSASRVDLTIDPGSVSTGQRRVDAFLKSNAVFDAENEKAIVFHSSSVSRTSDSGAVVKGKLTARGRSSTETFNVSVDSFSSRTIRFHVTGKVLRSRYGMDVGTPIYSNVVDFDMQFEAQR